MEVGDWDHDDYVAALSAEKALNEAAQARIAALEAANAELRHRPDDELRAIYAELEQEKAARASNKAAIVAVLGGEVDGEPTNATNYLQRARSLKAQRDGAISAGAAYAKDNAALRAEVERLKVDAGSLWQQQENARLLAEVERLEAYNKRRCDEIEQIQADRDALRAEVERLTDDLKGLRVALDSKKPNVSERLLNQKRTIDSMTADRAALRERCQAYSKSADAADAIDAALRERLGAAEQECELVARELDIIATREEAALKELKARGIECSEKSLNYPSEQRRMAKMLRRAFLASAGESSHE